MWRPRSPLPCALSPQVIAKAAEAFSAGDVVNRRVRQTQNWGFSPFAVVMGKNDDFPAKPDPASARYIAERIGLPPSAFLFVGDSAVDMQTANAAGMHAVGAAWGFRGPRELMENGCQTLVRHPREILAVLQ